MAKNWKKTLDKIVPYQPGKPIEEVKRELGLKKVYKLASNENPIGPSPAVLKAVRQAAKDINRYPDGGCFYLRQALSSKLSVDPENIVFGNGSDELIVLTLRTFVHPGEEVVVAKPTFLVYHIASMVEGAVVNVVPMKDYRYDLEGMLKAVTPKTKMVFIANPDNPTGSYVNKGELESFLQRLPRDVVVFIDEAYYEYARGGDYPETLAFTRYEDRDIIVARTFSKAYSLAGLRVGYAVARKDVAEAMNKVREPFNVNSLAQVAATTALADDAHVRKAVELVRNGKEEFYKTFLDAGLRYVPSRTNFVLVDTNRDSTKVFEYFLSKGIVVRDMAAWGLKGFIRVNVGLPKENKAFISAFKRALRYIPEITPKSEK